MLFFKLPSSRTQQLQDHTVSMWRVSLCHNTNTTAAASLAGGDVEVAVLAAEACLMPQQLNPVPPNPWPTPQPRSYTGTPSQTASLHQTWSGNADISIKSPCVCALVPSP